MSAPDDVKGYLERNDMEWRQHSPKAEPLFTLQYPYGHASPVNASELKVWLDEAAAITTAQWEALRPARNELTVHGMCLRQAAAHERLAKVSAEFWCQFAQAMPPARRWFHLEGPPTLALPEDRAPRPPLRLNRIAGAILATWPSPRYRKPNSCAF